MREGLPVLPGMLVYVNPEDSMKSKKPSKKKRLMGGSKKTTKKIENLFELVHPETTEQFLQFAGGYSSREIAHLRSEAKQTLLHAAVLAANVPLQDHLIREVEIDINTQDASGKAAIHLAAEMGSIESMKLLLHQPVLDCSVRDMNGNTFLHYLAAVRDGVHDVTMNQYVSLLRLALDKGASFFCNNFHYETPLHIAARHEQSWALAFAQQRFVNPNLVTKNWDTALHYAAKSGNLHGIQILLKQGADPFTVNRQSEFPGDLARKARLAEAKELFPSSPFMISLRGDEKSLLAQIGMMTAVEEDNDRMTLLHYAVVMGRLRVVKAILDNKDINTKSVNSRNINGNTPIHFFARLVPTKEHFNLYFELLQLMAVHSNDLFSLNYRSETPLHMAILTKNIISAKYLLQKGCPVNAPNLFGETPLHYATMCSSVKIVKLLITYGAIRARYAARPNVQPERPIDIAIKTFQHSIIFLLHIASNNSGPLTAHRAVPPTRPGSSTFASLDTWSEMYTSTSSSSSSMSSNINHPLPNRELEEKFVILECIGQGAYSVVHRALHLETSKEFAVKTFRSGKNLQAIGNEVGILKSCNHPQIVRYHSFFQDETKVSVVMDFCQLGSLYNIRKMVTFSEPTMMYVAKSVLEGLAYLHSKGLAHRDLKGHNILLDERGVVKIADFGVAKQYATDEDASTLSGPASENGSKVDSVKTEGVTPGTPLYMAPEVIQKKSSGRRADIWSFGVTMIALAEGAVPYSEHSKLSYIFSQIVEGDPPRLSPPRWSESFCEFIESCCQKNPDSRLSAKELLLHKFLEMDEAVARKDIEDVIQTFLGTSQTGSMSVSELEEFMDDFRSRLGKIEGAFGDSPSDSQNSSILSQVNRLALRSDQETAGSLATFSTQPGTYTTDSQASAVPSPPPSSSTYSLRTDSESYLSTQNSGYSTTSYVTSSHGCSSSSLREWYSESEDAWTIWVRFGDMEVIPVENLHPGLSVHDLKKRVKLHPELTELKEFSLPQLSLLDQKGNRLKPSGRLSDALCNNAHIEVVLLDLSKFESSAKPPPPQPQLLSQPQLSSQTTTSDTSSYYNPSSASYTNDGYSSAGYSHDRSRDHHHNFNHSYGTSSHNGPDRRSHEYRRSRSKRHERREMGMGD